MKIARSISLMFLILVLLVTGCSTKEVNQETTEDMEEEATILRLAGSDTGLPNPFKHLTRGPGLSKMQILYDSLMEKDENGNIPWLAKSWEISGDGTMITFKLQDDILWHDLTPMTSEDIAFTFSYYKDHPPVYNDLLVDGDYIVESTNIIDEKTIEVKLNDYDNNYLSKIGFTRIIPKHIWENVDDPITYEGEGATVGSGPYMLETYDPAQGMYRYTAFENYWGLTPGAEAIEWIPVSDNILAFDNGEIDLTTVTADVVQRYEKNENFEVKEVYSYHSYRLMMNMEKIVDLKDKNVRKALAYAIDTDELIEKVARGAGLKSSMGYVPSISPWYNENIAQYDYNPAKAKDLLDGRTYSFKLLTGNAPEEIKIAELMKLTLADVGIDLQVESVESKTRDKAVRTGDYDLLLIYSGRMGGDPDYLRSIYAAQSTGTSMSLATIKGYSNEGIIELAGLQAIEKDENTRKNMIFEMQEIIADDVPMIMLFGKMDLYVYRPDQYDGWMGRYDHNKLDHNKLSYLIRE